MQNERNYVLPILNKTIKMFLQSISHLSPKVEWGFHTAEEFTVGSFSFILHVLPYIAIYLYPVKCAYLLYYLILTQ